MVKTISATVAEVSAHQSSTAVIGLQSLQVASCEFDAHNGQMLLLCVPRWAVAVCPDCGQLRAVIHDYPQQRLVHAPLAASPWS